jgi:hypothetical protein
MRKDRSPNGDALVRQHLNRSIFRNGKVSHGWALSDEPLPMMLVGK